MLLKSFIANKSILLQLARIPNFMAPLFFFTTFFCFAATNFHLSFATLTDNPHPLLLKLESKLIQTNLPFFCFVKMLESVTSSIQKLHFTAAAFRSITFSVVCKFRRSLTCGEEKGNIIVLIYVTFYNIL